MAVFGRAPFDEAARTRAGGVTLFAASFPLGLNEPRSFGFATRVEDGGSAPRTCLAFGLEVLPFLRSAGDFT
ncbi:hypothetical protein VT52_028415 [Streptomyces malaysiense]|uniref:Uncharacterized protein n=1 Tax=Streptomyces malaysiense TaxID=1428626 RepID=A0A1J4PTW6_9ACTN|nr:hypothetical protein VT52_028415 [Streptomyces malaysiense]